MPDAECTVVVQLETCDKRECTPLGGLMVQAPTQLFIVSDGTLAGDAYARNLCQSLRSALLNTGAVESFPCACEHLMASEACAIRHQPQVRRVLVLVGSDQPAQYPHWCEEWLDLDPEVGCIVPVLPKGTPPFRVLPRPLRERIALFHHDRNVAAIVPDLLSVAGIGSDDFRLFISYRHEDVAGIATQLFHALSENRFNVFLDRFCGEPGRNFLMEIHDALADKACVLVLESPRAKESSYILGEINYAIGHKLGLMAVLLPKGIPFKSISEHEGARLDLRRAVIDARDPKYRLWGVYCQAIVDFVRKNYARQLERRRRYQANELRKALGVALAPSRALLPPAPTARIHTVTTPAGHPTSRQYKVIMTARAPAVSNLMRVKGACQSGEAGVVIGPLPFQRSPRGRELEWLSRISGVYVADEAFVANVAEAMVSGKDWDERWRFVEC